MIANVMHVVAKYSLLNINASQTNKTLLFIKGVGKIVGSPFFNLRKCNKRSLKYSKLCDKKKNCINFWVRFVGFFHSQGKTEEFVKTINGSKRHIILQLCLSDFNVASKDSKGQVQQKWQQIKVSTKI